MDKVTVYRRWIMTGYIGLILGGVIFLAQFVFRGVSVPTGAAVAWGLGGGTAIYGAGTQAIKLLESQITQD